MLRNIALLVVGGVAAVVFMLSCGNGGSEVDAQATCDCPAAEPPISDRIRLEERTNTVAAGASGGTAVGCNNPGEILLTGECRGDGVTLGAGVQLIEAGASDGRTGSGKPNTWGCLWHNTTANPVNVKAVAFCLTPPSN